MNLLEQIALAWQCLRFAFRQLLSPALWTPWLVLGAAEVVVIAALWWFAHPALSWLMAPLLSASAGAEALRYPNLFRVLPSLFARADLVILATLGALAAGVGTLMFASRAAGAPAQPGVAWRQGLGRALALLLVNLPLTLIAVALSYGLDAWLEARGSAGSTRRLADLVSLGAVFVCQAWFLYVNPLVMLAGNGWVAALAALPRMAGRGMIGALFMVVLTLVPVFAIQTLLGLAEALVDRGLPEMVGWLVLAQVGAGLLASFLLTGGATVFYQSALAEAGDGDFR